LKAEYGDEETNMRPLKITLIACIAFLLFGQADTTLQRAIRKETVEGDLKGAIELYRKAVGQAAKDRITAAQALVRMGACYEKLGDAEARKAYERVVRDFGDQKDMAAQAQTAVVVVGSPNAPLDRKRAHIAVQIFDFTAGQRQQRHRRANPDQFCLQPFFIEKPFNLRQGQRERRRVELGEADADFLGGVNRSLKNKRNE
jgi:tetratricopeptide (TPR) repeat protein